MIETDVAVSKTIARDDVLGSIRPKDLGGTFVRSARISPATREASDTASPELGLR